MVEKVAGQLVVYGPLGVLCVVLLFALFHLYRQKEKLTTDYQNEIRKLQEDHRAEIKILMERHIAKAETWVEKGNELAAKLQAVLESILKNQRRF